MRRRRDAVEVVVRASGRRVNVQRQFRDGMNRRRFIEPPPFNLANCYKDSSNLTPLVFILSKGSDPTKAFNVFCSEMKFHKKVSSLSLGQVSDSA